MKRMLTLVLVVLLAMTASGFALAEEAPKEEITVTILCPQDPSLRPKQSTTLVWDYIREETGINFERIVVQGQEQVQMMFASRDYPDMMMNVGATATQLAQAAEAGDLVDLWPLLQEKAPTWVKFFEENPIVYNMEKINGSIYTLPNVKQDPYERLLRDQWLYVYTWLDEIGMEVPTTTEEYKNVLIAIKEAAGTGTIPEGVIPWYYLFDSYVGGQFDIYGSFGVPVTTSDYLAVDPDGVVVCQAVNPDIKDALKYLQELYNLGLTPAECFTDDWNAYLSKVSSNPPIVFSYGSYANRLPAVTYPMGALDSETGRPSYIRPQTLTANPAYCTAIFSTCQHVDRIIEFFEWAAQPENAITMINGMEGVVWDMNEDGKYYLHFWESEPDLMNENAEYLGFNNSWFGVLDYEFYTEQFYNANSDIVGTREWAFDNIYSKQLPDWDCVYLSGALDEDSMTMMNQYGTDINEFRRQTFATWITTNADIDAEWDSYVEQMYAFGLEDWLELKQAAYDLVKG